MCADHARRVHLNPQKCRLKKEISHPPDRRGRRTEGHDLTLAFVGATVTQRFGHVLQDRMVALNQCGEGIFGDIHALRDSLSQAALLKKTY